VLTRCMVPAGNTKSSGNVVRIGPQVLNLDDPTDTSEDPGGKNRATHHHPGARQTASDDHALERLWPAGGGERWMSDQHRDQQRQYHAECTLPERHDAPLRARSDIRTPTPTQGLRRPTGAGHTPDAEHPPPGGQGALTCSLSKVADPDRLLVVTAGSEGRPSRRIRRT
jgi:hypothetical protein